MRSSAIYAKNATRGNHSWIRRETGAKATERVSQSSEDSTQEPLGRLQDPSSLRLQLALRGSPFEDLQSREEAERDRQRAH